jgi:hypothetical protein
MNAWNCAKGSILLDFRQTTVVLHKDIEDTHRAVGLALAGKEPLSRSEARMVLRAGRRLSQRLAELPPEKSRRLTRLRHLVGLAITAMRLHGRWPR